MSKRVFVTGGAGYIGAHCCKAFAQEGWEVIVYDNLTRGWRDFVRWGELIEGDLLNEHRLRTAIAHSAPHVVAHFAGLAYVQESMLQPSQYYRINTMGTLNLLDAMRANQVSAILFSSTCATYGTPLRTPIDEAHPQLPINPYGWSKFSAERAMFDFDRAYGVRAVALRYFNAAGADISGEIGERHEPEPHVIPLAIRGAIHNDYTFTIHGSDYDTRDGTAVRDYIHVNDLANAHCLALNYLVEGGESGPFNLGTGVGTTVGEIADTIERLSGHTVKRKLGARRSGDPASLVASFTRARQVLGWSPQYSDIDTIISTAWRWHSQMKV
jgi:UDP-arabinose 4-epimerase